jgi:hypothetical protein
MMWLTQFRHLGYQWDEILKINYPLNFFLELLLFFPKYAVIHQRASFLFKILWRLLT